MTAEQSGSEMDLRQQMEKLKEEFLSQAPETVKAMEQATEELIRSGIAGLSLKEGNKAPAFALPDATGRLVRLSDYLALGPAVVTFYRGAW
jgi:hypothetical protein